MTAPANRTAILTPSLRPACVRAISDLVESRPTAKTIRHLRNEFGQPLADLLPTVAGLQTKAFRKLGCDDHNRDRAVWWVTEKSLQQATPWQVAQLKSGWFGDRPVIDLCCGIGGDAVPLSRRGKVIAVDIDPQIVELVETNLETFGGDDYEVCCADVSNRQIDSGSGVHIDPDRRSGGKRTTRPQAYQPAWSDVARIARQSAAAVIKLAPMAEIDRVGLEQVECHNRCWISLQRSVREQTLLCGDVADFAGLGNVVRTAFAIDASGRWNAFAADARDWQADDVRDTCEPQALIVDPDPAIRAAALTNAYAMGYQLQTVGGPQGFLTTQDVEIESNLRPLSICGKVVWQGVCDVRKIRQALRQRDAFVSTVKVRGTKHDPAVLIKRLGKTGDHPVTLWIGRTEKSTFAAMTDDHGGR